MDCQDPTLPDKIVLLESTDLTFNLDGALVFGKAPFEELLYLQSHNHSCDLKFTLQIHPSEFFQAFPCFGVVKAGQSVPIRVKYTGSAQSVCEEIQGFIRVRNEYGFPMERIQLTAYNGTALRLYPQTLDFGIISSHEKRTAFLYIQNILSCTVQVVVISSNSNKFSIEKSQISLKPKELYSLAVRMDTFESDGPVHGQLIVLSMNQLFQVELSGTIGQSFQLIDKKLDFGFSDIFYSGSLKRILLRNPHNDKVKVSSWQTSPEIIVNHSKPILLEPHQDKLVSVEFKPDMTGDRHETVIFYAPFASRKSLEVHSYTGSQLLIPILEDVFFPVATNECPSSVQIPFVNTTNSPLQFLISMPNNAPFGMEIIEQTSQNTKGTSPIEMKKSENNAGCNYLVTTGPFKAGMMDFTFYPHSNESVRIPLDIQLVKPRKGYVKTLYLNALSVNGIWHKEKSNNGYNLDKERRFTRAPMRHPFLKSDYRKGNFDVSKKGSQKSTSTCFQSEVVDATIFGTYLEQKLGMDIYDYVDVFNLTDKFQPYHILLSQFFVTDIPLDGGIPSQSVLRIPIRLNKYYFSLGIGIHPDTEFYTGIGTLSIFDESNGFLSISLHGVMGDPVGPEIRPTTRKIKFAGTIENDKQLRRVYIRNRTPKEILWEGGIGSMESKGLVRKSNTDWCPFVLSVNRIVLKPFEYYPLDIIFQSSVKGIAQYKLFMEYRDSFQRQGEKDSTTTDPNRPIMDLILEGGIGSTELEIYPDPLFLGNVPLGSMKSQDITIANHGSLCMNVMCHDTQSFSVSSDVLTIPPQSTTTAQVEFRPFDCKMYSQNLFWGDLEGSAAVQCIGIGGVYDFRFSSDTMRISGDNYSYKCDLKMMELGCERKKVFLLWNHGTFDIFIHSILTQDDSMDVQVYQDYRIEGHMDWDEYDYHASNGENSKTTTLINQKCVGFQKHSRESLFKTLTCIPPGRFIKLVVGIMAKKTGPFCTSLKIQIDSSPKDKISCELQISGNVQPKLVSKENCIDFGIRGMYTKSSIPFHIFNKGSVELEWSLALTSITFQSLMKSKTAHESHTGFLNPFKAIPAQGVLKPEEGQIIQLEFSPSAPGHQAIATAILNTKNLGESTFLLKGIGASCRLHLDCKEINFGILRVGTKKTLQIKLRNEGILTARYFLETSNTQFSADPEQGVLEGYGEVDLNVTYAPKGIGDINTYLLVTPWNMGQDTIQVKLKGSASYPDIFLITKFIDFGTALFMTPNKKVVKVENKGLADAELSFHSLHPALTLSQSSNDAIIRIKPKMIEEITLVYTPTLVEDLNTKVFIRSNDSRGTESMMNVRGTVGIPKLEIEPSDVVNGISFGVSEIGKVVQKTFTIQNQGNIVLTYRIQLQLISEESVPIDDDSLNASQISQLIYDVDPSFGTLDVGQSQQVTLFFSPHHTKNYQYDLLLNYDFQSKKIPIKGTGGKYILSLDDFATVDFGICRLNRTFKKVIKVKNAGNLGFAFRLRPEPQNKDWKVYDQEDMKSAPTTSEPSWMSTLRTFGLSLSKHSGFCEPFGSYDIILDFSPKTEAMIMSRLRLFYGELYRDIEVQGRAASPRLNLVDSVSHQTVVPGVVPTIDIGVHPVNSTYGHVFYVLNESPFGLDFFIQPMIMSEFDVKPIRGFVQPNNSVPITIRFRPTAETNYKTTLKLMWELQSIRALISGKGGLGKLSIQYANEDSDEQGLNFGMVPLSSSCEKRFAIKNVGMVAMSVFADLLHDEFMMAQASDPVQLSQIEASFESQHPTTKKLLDYKSNFRIVLEPDMGIEVAVKYTARSTSLASSTITIKTEFERMNVRVSGKGGTISLSHHGDLNFGDIACNYVYSRKITIVNSGSISSTLTAELSIVGHSSSESGASYIKLHEVYNAMDPRSGWARQQLCKEKNISDPNFRFSPRELWRLLIIMVRKNVTKEDAPVVSASSRKLGARRASVIAMSMMSSHLRVGGDSTLGMPSKKVAAAGGSSHFKRRQMFYHLITTTQVTSQSTPRLKPFIKVDPSTNLLPSFGDISFLVELNLSSENALLGTLLIKSDIPNTPTYEIPLSANPKAVNIVCDDTRMINFYRQPLGDSETMTRTFTNVGHKDITYKFINQNTGLTIQPSKGSLRMGQTISVTFTFKPVDESIQNSEIVFEPDCSQPIRLKMYGGGGYAKASLSRYRRFDFGHCMIGKDTISYLPIINEGNAILHLTKFELIETDTFFRGQDWPTSRISLFPGKSYNLPIVFNPHEESPPPGRLIVGSSSEKWEIELIGLGREAVLIVSKVALEFSECLIGNSYEQRLGLKNIGDVNYPVTFKLEKEFPDLEFVPSSMIITPFSENFVVISYTPSRETKTTVVLIISSPYSMHKVPLLLHSGTAILEFESTLLDFGMFEKSTKPSLSMNFKNIGTVKTSYFVRDANKPSMFFISQPKGILHPGKSVEVTFSHIKHQVEEFEERLIVRTDLIDKIYTIKVKGQCEETVLHAEEFSLLNLGICPVLESTTKPLTFRNYGKFPLEYNIKASYPLKVTPSMGKVPGNSSETVSVIWSPSGGYELRTQITMMTNIGSFNLVIRGKAAFPEIYIDNMYLDFGVCASGYSYAKNFKIENKGKVPLRFMIPDPKDPAYTVSTCDGYLQPKESVDVLVFFKPSSIGRFMSSVVVECKGIHYKEIILVGVGGNLKFDIKPSELNLGRCPFNLQVYHTLSLSNNGDVSLNVDFVDSNKDSEECQFVVPESMKIAPGKTVKCVFGITVKVVGPFSSNLFIKTRENSFAIPIVGTGIKIVLTKRNKEILESERLPVLLNLDMATMVFPHDDLNYLLKKNSTTYKLDMFLIDYFSQLFAAVRQHSQVKLHKSAMDPSFKAIQLDSKRREILDSLEKLDVEKSTTSRLDDLFDEFLVVKQKDYQEPILMQESVIEDVLNYGHVKIQNIDLNSVLQTIEPSAEANLSDILSRPPPFGDIHVKRFHKFVIEIV